MSPRTPATAPSPRSQALLLRLSRLPRLLVPAVVLALTVTGLAAPPWIGVPCLLLVVAFVGWLATLSWPVLPAAGRVLRLLTAGLLLAAAAGRATGNL